MIKKTYVHQFMIQGIFCKQNIFNEWMKNNLFNVLLKFGPFKFYKSKLPCLLSLAWFLLNVTFLHEVQNAWHKTAMSQPLNPNIIFLNQNFRSKIFWLIEFEA